MKGDLSSIGKKRPKKNIDAINAFASEAKVDGDAAPENPENPEEKRVGRPKKANTDKRKPRIMLNVSDAEFELLSEVCEDLGVPIAVFAREQALKKAKVLKDI